LAPNRGQQRLEDGVVAMVQRVIAVTFAAGMGAAGV
jgi:hypothetical protein